MMAKERFGSGEISDNGLSCGPTPDFLWHLQQRMSVDERTAAETLQFWMSTYEPGPNALARVHMRADG